ncbi:MAG: hypothetical protein EBZ07_05675, partial [Verrucomicrobia bacterium]|nr:hypothetical protein [Verrucomicrobiota bacterium]
RDVGDHSETGVGGLTKTKGNGMVWHVEKFNRTAKTSAMGRKPEKASFIAVLKCSRNRLQTVSQFGAQENFLLHCRGEYDKLLRREANVVASLRQTIANGRTIIVKPTHFLAKVGLKNVFAGLKSGKGCVVVNH